MPLDELSGSVAVVTGAGSGIGRALAHRLAADGAEVVAVDVEAATVEETAAGSERITASVVDVSDRAAVMAFADRVHADRDAVDLLVNNAGVFQGGVAWERTPEDWQWVLGVNLHGLINGVDAFLPRMLARGGPGHVVNTASMAGHVCAPFSGPYQVSKFAAYGYSESLAHDLVAQGAEVGVSVLCPSLIATDIGTSNRNRPDDLPPSGGEDVEFVEDALVQMTGELGLDPDVVAGQVIDAVRAGDFLIPTNDDYRSWIEGHAEDLVARRLPRMVTYT